MNNSIYIYIYDILFLFKVYYIEPKHHPCSGGTGFHLIMYFHFLMPPLLQLPSISSIHWGRVWISWRVPVSCSSPKNPSWMSWTILMSLVCLPSWELRYPFPKHFFVMFGPWFSFSPWEGDLSFSDFSGGFPRPTSDSLGWWWTHEFSTASHAWPGMERLISLEKLHFQNHLEYTPGV